MSVLLLVVTLALVLMMLMLVLLVVPLLELPGSMMSVVMVALSATMRHAFELLPHNRHAHTIEGVLCTPGYNQQILALTANAMSLRHRRCSEAHTVEGVLCTSGQPQLDVPTTPTPIVRADRPLSVFALRGRPTHECWRLCCWHWHLGASALLCLWGHSSLWWCWCCGCCC